MTPQWPWGIWLGVAALTAAALPILRVRERLRTPFPRVAAICTATMAAWVVFLIGLALWSPASLSVLMALVLVGLAAAAWYSHPAFGRSRGLPAGSLSLPVSVAAITDRDFYRQQAARYGPIFKMAQFHQPVVCVVGLERGHRLLREHDAALGPSPQRVTEAIPKGFLRYMNDDVHALYGPLFRQALSSQIIADSLPAMRAAVRCELARTPDTRAHGIEPTPILERVTDAAFVRAFFGVEPGSAVFDAMARAYGPLARLRLSETLTPEARTGLAELRELVSACANQPSQASRSAITELSRLAPHMPDDTCTDNLIFMWKVSAPNAVGLLRWLVATLGENPEWCARLQAELRRDGSDGQLLDRVVSETLRLSQSEYLYRRVRQDFSFEGFRVPKNWLVRICVWESHRDSQIFEEPDRFNPDRFLQQDYTHNTYSPFGSGRHACNGVPLSMAIARAFFEELSQAWNWSVTGHGTIERDFRHWSHWRPGRSLRLVLRDR